VSWLDFFPRRTLYAAEGFQNPFIVSGEIRNANVALYPNWT